MSALWAQRVLIEDALDQDTTGEIVGQGRFMEDSGWRSSGGKIVYDVGHVITNGYFEAFMRGWTAPAQGTAKSHPLSGWEIADHYTHDIQVGSFWNWRIGTGYSPFKVLARPHDQVDRLDDRVGSNSEVNDGQPHHYRVEWNAGRVTFIFDGALLAEWQFSRFNLQHFTVGKDDKYPITNPAPIISDIQIVDRDLHPIIPVEVIADTLAPAVYLNAYTDTIRVDGGIAPLTWQLLEGALPSDVILDMSNGVISGLPAASGDYACVVGIGDSNTPVQTDTAHIVLTVSNDAPVILSADSASVYEDSLFVYQPQAMDVNNNTLNIDILDLPSWLDWDEAIVSGIAPLGSADTSFVVTASDGEMTDSITVNLSILNLPSTVDDLPAGAPMDFTLDQNYPNPFNAATTLSYTMDAAAHIRLDVFDMRGGHVARLLDRHQEPGHYQHHWDAVKQSSGIYLVRLQRGDSFRQIKILLIK